MDDGERSDEGPGSGIFSYRATEDLARELNLSQGQVLRTRVARRLTEDRILLSVRGRRVVAHSKLDVEPGDSLLVEVRSTDHPIELKLHEPSRARESLDEDALRRLLTSMGLQPNARLLSIARNWIARRVYLDETLLRLSARHWPHLTDEQGQPRNEYLDALLALFRHQCPVTPGLIEAATVCPKWEEFWKPWTDPEAAEVIFRVEDDKRMTGSGLRETLVSLGLDYVSLIGRRPRTASRTLHARILDRITNGRASHRQKQIQAQMVLAAALSARETEPSILLVPFSLGDRISVAWIEVPATEMGTGEPPGWKARGYVSSSGNRIDGFRMETGPSGVQIELQIRDSEYRNQMGQQVTRLKNSLQHREIQATIEVTNTRAGPPDFFQSPTPEPGSGSTRTVNMLA